MRNPSFSHVGTPTRKYQPGIRGLKVANSSSTLVGKNAGINSATKDMARAGKITRAGQMARRGSGLPLQFTGCVSDLSCSSEDHRAYDEALKNYVEVYRVSHSYIESGSIVIEHDYTLNVAETEEHGLLGLVGDEIEQTMRSHVHFSDEEIEQCGYLGWLQH